MAHLVIRLISYRTGCCSIGVVNWQVRKNQLLQANASIIIYWICLTGFSDPLIHMFNKDDRHIKHTPYHNRLRERQHVILLGDGMGDVDMADGKFASLGLP